jgi:hypothetical protein
VLLALLSLPNLTVPTPAVHQHREARGGGEVPEPLLHELSSGIFEEEEEPAELFLPVRPKEMRAARAGEGAGPSL